jgi:hypothetical protein
MHGAGRTVLSFRGARGANPEPIWQTEAGRSVSVQIAGGKVWNMGSGLRCAAPV